MLLAVQAPIFGVLFALLTTLPAPALAAPARKNVLFIYSFSKRDTFDSLEQLKSVIRNHAAVPVDFNVEYLDSQRLGTPSYQNRLSETLREAYRETKIDLVVVGAYPALRFAIDHRQEIFPGVPIVFMMVAPGRIKSQKVWSGVTGVTIPSDVRGTINLASQLDPDTRNVAIISGSSEFEQYWLQETRRELGHYQPKLDVIELIDLPPEQLLNRLKMLPRHSIALFELIPSESVQPAMGIYEVLAAVSERLPTYCIHNYCLDHGAIGGSYPDADEQIITAGTIAARVLAGEAPENIPIVHGSIDHAQVDWRELKQWHLSESRLPKGSLVLYRQATFWERDKRYILAAVGLILIQFLLIVALLWQRARKLKAEAVLRESEKRFRVMADTTPSLIWICDREGKITYLNHRSLAFTGLDPGQEVNGTWTAHVQPDDLKHVLDAISQALMSRESFSREYRLRRSDGVYRWMFDVASPRMNGDGSFAGFIGSAIDITDQKLAQEALENLSGRLIEAQEKERSRIARDLHDDICQRLALLSMELEQVNRNGVQLSTNKQLQEIRQHCAEITGDIQSLSHQLHSSKLEYLGVVAATRGFCDEFAKQHDVTIDFKNENMPTRLSKNVSLCLFRITQEALHNAAKYSGTRQYSVTLTGTDDEVRLIVKDQGVGFDVEQARRNRGLGLVSMQERANLVHGQFGVEAKRGTGTTVTVVVPLTSGGSKALAVDAVDDTAMASGNL